MSLFPDLQTQTDLPQSHSVGSTTPLNSLQSTPISKGLELFIGEKEYIRDKTEDEIRNSVKFLTECFGDIPIGDITKEKSNIIKSHIKNYPKNRTKNPKYRDYDFHSLMKMGIPQKDIIHLSGMSVSEKVKCIDVNDKKIIIIRQCELMQLPRSSYNRPRSSLAEGSDNLVLMSLIDEE